MKTMTPEQRVAKNLAQKAYRAKKKREASPEAQGLPAREESDAARAMTEDHDEEMAAVEERAQQHLDEPLPPVLDPVLSTAVGAPVRTVREDKIRAIARAPRRAVADLPTRVFAARIPHGRYDEIKAMAKRADVSICDLILQGIDLLKASR